MNLEVLAHKLQTDGVGIKGVNIFVHHMPQSAETGILLKMPYIPPLIDYELPGYRRERFNLIVRSKKYQTGEELARKAVTSLTLSETQLTGMDIRYMRPERDLVPYPLNEADMTEFLVIFGVVYVIL